jgi:hypothetical protein
VVAHDAQGGAELEREVGWAGDALCEPLQDAGPRQMGERFRVLPPGGPGDTAVTRSACSVSGQNELFFPLVNAFDVHTPGDGLDTPKKVYKDFQSFGFRADTLNASVDGVPVGNLDPVTTPYRACAAPVAGCTPSSFSLTFPDDNLFGLPAGTYAPAVQDGYYLLLAPPKPGRHTIRFGGTGNFGGPFRRASPTAYS